MTERKLPFLRGLLVAVVVCVLPLCLWWWFGCGPATTLLIVRHADRVGTQDALKQPEGVVRAQELVHVVGTAGIVAIYRSDTNRSRDTAEPLATALGITPVVYPANNTAPLVNDIFADHRGEKVFVVGHSNTIPQIISAAGGPSIPNIADSVFDNLFVLTACRCRHGLARLVNLKYGAVTP
ncbi:MAG: histidine phosphatase family protein [Nitrospirota bacterium]